MVGNLSFTTATNQIPTLGKSVLHCVSVSSLLFLCETLLKTVERLKAKMNVIEGSAQIPALNFTPKTVL